MKKQQNIILPALQPLISPSAVLLTLRGAAAPNQFGQKPPAAGLAVQSGHRCAAVSTPNDTSKRPHTSRSARVEFLASRPRVGGCEIAGFSARQAQTAEERNLTPQAAPTT